ncbi:MAG: phospholipase A2 [Myxococcota bacterium]
MKLRKHLVLIAVGLGFTVTATASTKERFAGGKNEKFRRYFCHQARALGSYHLPGKQLSRQIRVRKVKWHPGNYTTPRGKVWQRKSPGGVCEMEVYFPKRKRSYTFFDDGCSGQAPGNPPGGADTWGEMFHRACVYHDHCYHHEPRSARRSQKWCDDRMLADMNRICSEKYGRQRVARGRCRAAAKVMHAGLRAAGAKHYAFDNTFAPYDELYERRR